MKGLRQRMDDTPEFEWTEKDDPPPLDFARLLVWLRDTYCLRVYIQNHLDIPPEFARGYTEKMVAMKLKAHGFHRCHQSMVSRMEHHHTWPGRYNVDERAQFLAAAPHCYGITSRRLLLTLEFALCMAASAEAMPPTLLEYLRLKIENDPGDHHE